MSLILEHPPALGPDRLRFTCRFLLALLAGAATLALTAGWLSWRLGMEVSGRPRGLSNPNSATWSRPAWEDCCAS